MQIAISIIKGEQIMNLSEAHCIACKGGTPPLTDTEEEKYFKDLAGWVLTREGTHKLHKEIRFQKYIDGVEFVREAGVISDAEDHHPDIHLFYKKVIIELYTHAVNGLSINDFVLAAKIDRIKS
jgi:4a-hydroxytetrahydrobiopterin dehydratase